MKNLTKKSLIIFSLLFLIFIIPTKIYADNNIEETDEISQAKEIDLTTEKVETNFVTINTFVNLIDSNYVSLSKLEIENLFKSMADKSFTELTKTEFDHENKICTFQFYVNEDDGNLNTLISTEIYNFLKATKDCVDYTIKFEVSAIYTDSNGRYMKKLINIYTYKPETLILISWNNQEPSKILDIADEIFDSESNESTVINKQKENKNQLKVINLLKYYISEKINSEKINGEKINKEIHNN